MRKTGQTILLKVNFISPYLITTDVLSSENRGVVHIHENV